MDTQHSPLAHLSRSLLTTAPLPGQQISMLHPPAQIIGIEGVERAFAASGVLEPLPLAEAVCRTCLASSLPRHLQEGRSQWPTGGPPQLPGVPLQLSWTAAAVAEASLRQVILQKLYATP
jgi:hypothetical protein